MLGYLPTHTNDNQNLAKFANFYGYGRHFPSGLDPFLSWSREIAPKSNLDIPARMSSGHAKTYSNQKIEKIKIRGCGPFVVEETFACWDKGRGNILDFFLFIKFSVTHKLTNNKRLWNNMEVGKMESRVELKEIYLESSHFLVILGV